MPPTLPFSSAPDGVPSDLLLVRAALAGEEQAISAFIQRMTFVPRVLTSQNKKLRIQLDREELADVVQETLAVIWRRLPAFSGESTLEHWSYTICTFTIMNAARRRKRRLRMGSDALLAERPARAPATESSELDHEAVHEALLRIPASHAQVIQLRSFDELSFPEIGQRLGISPAKAKNLYHSGLRMLGTLLRSFQLRELS